MGVIATESGINYTVQKRQDILIAELISRVTSLEDTVEFILKQLPITEVCSEAKAKEVVKDYIVATYGSIDNI